MRLKPRGFNTRQASNLLSVSKLGQGILPGWRGLQHKVSSALYENTLHLHTYFVFFRNFSIESKFKPLEFLR